MLLCPEGLPGLSLVLAQSSPASQARHAHDSLTLGLVTAGARRIATGRGETFVPAGAVFVLAPDQAHACAPASPGGCSYLALSIGPPALPEALAKRLKRRPPARPRLDDRDLARTLERLAEAFAHPAGRLERQSLVAECLERLAGHFAGQDVDARERGDAGAPRGAVVTALRLLEEAAAGSAGQCPDLAELAKACGAGMYALHRAFTRAVGLPPHAHLVRLRLRRAKELLRAGAGLAEAALGAGFCDQAHMNRCFTRVVGLSPGRYVRAHRARSG